MRQVYLDYQASTPVDQRVVEAMLASFYHDFGNPSQRHCFGVAAKEIIERAGNSLLKALGAENAQIIFNSGATESNNMAIFGVLQKKDLHKAHIILPATEHSSVLEPGQYLALKGQSVSFIKPDASGIFSPDEIEAVITEQTVLLSVMAVNNEIGVIQPLAEIGRLCRRKGVIFHCDATQAIGRIAIDMSEMCIDMLSISAHKFYGPKGVGALILKNGELIAPCALMHGGGQQNNLRPGTINVSGIAGMEKAFLLSVAEMESENQRLKGLSQLFWERLFSAIPDIKLNGSARQRISCNLNISFPGIAIEALMMALPEIAFSAGSACNGEKKQASHVLKAIGLDDSKARSSARFSFGRFTTEAEIIYTTERIIAAVLRLRAQKKTAELTELTEQPGSTKPTEFAETAKLSELTKQEKIAEQSELTKQEEPAKPEIILPKITEKIDLRQLKCPENYARMLMRLEAMDVGEVLSALVSGIEAKNNILANLEPDGYRLLQLIALDETDWEFIIQV